MIEIKHPALEDAQQMAKQHPKTFQAPALEEIEKKIINRSPAGMLAEKFYAKVCTGGERFWVSVVKVSGDELIGIIDNVLVNTDKHDLMIGDFVALRKENIYSIDVPEEEK